MSLDKKGNALQSTLKGHSLGYTDNYPKREMWKEIAKELGGEFKSKHTSGYDLEIHEIKLPCKKWSINISVSDSRPLKFQISFTPVQDFKLVLSWEDIIDKIIKKFNRPEIRIGWNEFDKQYLIKSNRSDLVKKIFTKEIQKTMLRYNIYSLSYQTNSSKGIAELLSTIQRRAGNKEMIFELIQMFKMLIDNMEKARIIK